MTENTQKFSIGQRVRFKKHGYIDEGNRQQPVWLIESMATEKNVTKVVILMLRERGIVREEVPEQCLEAAEDEVK